VIDATNPVLADLSGLTLGTTVSAGEQVQQWASGAKVVKAFNTIGSNILADARFGSERALLAYCGDDAEAKHIVRQLAEELGFDPLDAVRSRRLACSSVRARGFRSPTKPDRDATSRSNFSRRS